MACSQSTCTAASCPRNSLSATLEEAVAGEVAHNGLAVADLLPRQVTDISGGRREIDRFDYRPAYRPVFPSSVAAA